MFGTAKIAQLEAALVLGQEHVFQLDVAVDDGRLLLMQRCNGKAHVGEDLRRGAHA